MLGRWKKWMAESLLPFQCNHVDVEGLWKKKNKKNNTKTKKRESGDGKKKEKEKKKKEEEEEEEEDGEIAAEDEAFTSTTSSTTPLPFVLLPTIRLGKIGLFFFFFFWFNFIVRIGFCFLFGLFETFFESEAKSDRLVLPSSCVSFSFVFLCFYFLFLFFLGSDSKGTVRSGLITVLRTVWLNCGSNGFLFFGVDRFLSLKNRDGERFTVFLVGPYSSVRVSKPWA